VPELSRRGFLSSSAGLTIAGVAMVAGPGLAAVVPEISSEVDSDVAPTLEQLNSVGPVVVHVRDAAAGVLSVLSGETEVIIHDPDFVARIVTAAGGRAL
jgi:hypothetical protein